jgi:hypothetical protein
MVGTRRCRLLSLRDTRERKCSMKKRIPLLLMVALFVLALYAPAAMAQDDDGGDDDVDDDAATATATATASPTATATATAGAEDDDDRAAAAAAGGALPKTGGPALIAPIAGALLIGGGVVGGIALSRSRDDS